MSVLDTPDIDWTGCALVESNPRKLSGTPVLKGTRMPAAAILENHTDGMSPDEIAEVFELPPAAVRAFLAFVHAHQTQIP